MKSSPAWHKNARAARARARRASHRGDITESQLWRILNHHGSEMTKNTRQLWCVKCSSWKWANGTKCHCRAKESGKPLNGWSARCLKTGSSGNFEVAGGSKTECCGGSTRSFGVRRTDTAGQGCHIPLRPSTRADLQASDGHWKGREYCEEPQGAIVAVAASTREVAGPSV